MSIGARVTVTAGGRTQIQDVVGGGSYFSQSARALFFRLGEATTIDGVRIDWPRGEAQELRDLGANTRYRIVEGQAPQRR